MEWLTNLLGMAKNGAASSPFGALGGGGGGMPPQPPQPGAMPGQMPGQPPPMPGAPPVPFMNPQTGAPVATPPQAPGGMPGLLGQFMSRMPGGNSNPLMQQIQQTLSQNGGAGEGKKPDQQNPGQAFALNQAMSMLKPPQMQPTQWMAPWQRR